MSSDLRRAQRSADCEGVPVCVQNKGQGEDEDGEMKHLLQSSSKCDDGEQGSTEKDEERELKICESALFLSHPSILGMSKDTTTPSTTTL